MPTRPPPFSDAAKHSGALRGLASQCARMAGALLVLLSLCCWGRAEEIAIEPLPAADTAAGEQAKDASGMFLPSDNGRVLWRQTLATVAVDWPVVRTI